MIKYVCICLSIHNKKLFHILSYLYTCNGNRINESAMKYNSSNYFLLQPAGALNVLKKKGVQKFLFNRWSMIALNADVQAMFMYHPSNNA